MGKIRRRFLWQAVLLGVILAGGFQKAQGQQLAWEAAPCFAYVIQAGDIVFDSATRVVRVDFSVTNPSVTTNPFCQKYGSNSSWDILNDLPFTQSPALSTLRIDIGWTTKEFTNTGTTGSLVTKPWGNGLGAAYPITIDALRGPSKAVAIGGGKFRVFSASLPPEAVLTGRVAIEGHPAWQNSSNVWIRVPVKSEVQDFVIEGAKIARRDVVDIAKCQACHNGVTKDAEGVAIPRLSLHGANRNENLGLCQICHNPNQTDIPYRTSGAEVSVDFKRMVHSIHASEIRKEPFVVIGFQGSVNDYSAVAFPAKPRNCLACHIDAGGKGTFEIPPTSAVATYALGSTVESLSVPGTWVDVDPSNDYKITPIAAACSACHDDRETRQHMESKGASFHIQQANIRYWNGTTPGMERCPACHGPGKEKDVRKVHDIRKSGDEHDDD